MHFSREVLKRMEIKGIESTYLTSHMSLGNFREIDVEDLTKHKMDSEQMTVPVETTEVGKYDEMIAQLQESGLDSQQIISALIKMPAFLDTTKVGPISSKLP